MWKALAALLFEGAWLGAHRIAMVKMHLHAETWVQRSKVKRSVPSLHNARTNYIFLGGFTLMHHVFYGRALPLQGGV